LLFLDLTINIKYGGNIKVIIKVIIEAQAEPIRANLGIGQLVLAQYFLKPW
jgi:hypothetical protein